MTAVTRNLLVWILGLGVLGCGRDGAPGGNPGTAGATGSAGIGGEGGALAGAGGDAGSGAGDGGQGGEGGAGTGAGGTGQGTTDAGTDPGDASPEAGAAVTLGGAAAQTARLFGAALTAQHLSEPDYAATAARELGFATPENEMKWDATEPTRDVFTFERADAVVAFAAQHGMQVKGHTLVWHSQLPPWVSAIADPVDLRNAMINHIIQVVSHFRGKVAAWDVVNEAFADTGRSLRNTIFLQQLGPRYIDDAFLAAHAADPDARLYYNDYGAEGRSGKADAVYELVGGMRARGIPIHGVGLQMHTGTTDTSPSAADLAGNMQRLADLGLEVAITELDVAICTGDLEAQGRRFHDIVARCVAQPACKSVTVWGVTDKYSWRNGQTCATPRPLLFDDTYMPKPAYSGVLEALLGR